MKQNIVIFALLILLAGSISLNLIQQNQLNEQKKIANANLKLATDFQNQLNQIRVQNIADAAFVEFTKAKAQKEFEDRLDKSK